MILKVKKPKIKEVDVARPVVTHFLDLGYDVYQEVPLGGYLGGIVDICVLNRTNKEVHLIEVKTGMNKKLYEQARRWRRCCLKVSIAVPRAKRGNDRREKAAIEYDKDHIGVIYVDMSQQSVIIRSDPNETNIDEINSWYKFNEKDSVKLLEQVLHLPDEYKTYCEAGSAHGGHLTAFKVTVMNLADYVKEHQGCTITEAVKNIDHHYSSDKSAASNLSSLPKVLKKVGGIVYQWSLYIEEDQNKGE